MTLVLDDHDYEDMGANKRLASKGLLTGHKEGIREDNANSIF